MDSHRDAVVATEMAQGSKKEIRTSSTDRNALRELRNWFTSLSIPAIVMESTGIYWKPVFNIPKENVDILLVSDWHIKNVTGYKTAKKDRGLPDRPSVPLTGLLLSTVGN